LFSPDKIFFAQKKFCLRRIKLRHRKNTSFGSKQHRFPVETFCFRRTKSLVARKSLVLAGQNLFFGENILFLPDKIFSGEKQFCLLRIKLFLVKRDLLRKKAVGNGPTKIVFLPNGFRWHGGGLFWLEGISFFLNRLRSA
jgi:hypothetical protein